MASSEPIRPHQRKLFVLCFDGTNNKFSGTEKDSNILKLYRMLDRTDANVYTFYQPGIGTYVASHFMQSTSAAGRARSWYLKVKDSAFGSSFAEHVMGAYRYLMKHYSIEDDLYLFGFSRGAYTARFLAEMLDQIGLINAGNEELVRFTWKTYADWAARRNDGTIKAQLKEDKQETFSRPVRRIRFLGLFDTVNSVPKFENAWMQRTRFPYTAKPSAKVIRHAVSIDERRAKFRQDLVAVSRPQSTVKKAESASRNETDAIHPSNPAIGGQSEEVQSSNSPNLTTTLSRVNPSTHKRLLTPNFPQFPKSLFKKPPLPKVPIRLPSIPRVTEYTPRRYSGSDQGQDVNEVWFAGGHSDIGGGWRKATGETWPLSHTPLVWMIHEAEAAGLKFDAEKMANFLCIPESVDENGERKENPKIREIFLRALQESYRNGVIHDSLEKGPEVPARTANFWKMIEYLPFRRMDLQPDGSWKVIRWPLPMGEPRDIPSNANIHYSAIERMRSDPDYRPGNLIVGGGGRGVRIAPAEFGIGNWELMKWPGDPIKETFVRKTGKAQKIDHDESQVGERQHDTLVESPNEE
ncbi:hypothetical protein LTR84_008091 [Exophiala bonariae]|uniref:T6SS Phospholipase effector Tle1-like catalytic domain-containing protein n=1 Tax=Exophiala bonariae TaxID=1690606 RepID=A0AAV9NPC2_9EURO|nr:hypothetical protein LTR84_008091 [Exophiala bonariae]